MEDIAAPSSMEIDSINISEANPSSSSSSSSIPSSSSSMLGTVVEEETLSGSAPSEVAEIDSRPLIERIADKNWKTRMVAYEDLKKDITSGGSSHSSNDLYNTFLEWIPKMTADINAGALDSGLDTAIAYVDTAPITCISKVAEKVVANVVDKAFSGKPSSIVKGKSLLLKLMEVDEPALCVSFLLTKLNDKRPKIPPLCLDVIKEGIIAFGAKAFAIKDIIAAIVSVLNGSNGSARESAFSLMIEMTRWIGRVPFNAMLEGIRSAQKTEFEKLYAEKASLEGSTPIPTVWLRKNRPAPGSEQAVIEAMKSSKSDLDGREFVDEVDITKKLKGTDFSSLMVEEKWSEQLKGLQIVIDALGPNPKVKSGSDVHEIIQHCKTFLRQGHIQLQLSSLKIVSLLADGMRAEFASSVRPITQAIILKAKEKKLVADVQAALTSILKFSLQFDSLADDIIENIKNKKNPPHARLGLIEFVALALANSPDRVSSDSLKPIAESFVFCIDDSDPKIRETCSMGLGTLSTVAKSRGKAASDANKVISSLETIAPKVYKKILAGGVAAAIDQAAAPSSPPKAKPLKKTEEPEYSTKAAVKKPTPAVSSSSSSLTKSATSLPSKKPTPAVQSSTTIPTKSTTAGKTSIATEAEEDVEDLTMGFDEAFVALAGLGIEGWETSIQEKMDSAKWQDKVEVLGLLGEKVAELKGGGQYSAPLVIYLSTKTSGFKISNVNILKAVVQFACVAAKNVGESKFSKSAAWELIKHFGEKISDKKANIGELLNALAEAMTPSFVFKRMKHVIDKSKAPLAHQYFLEWLKDAIKESGSSSVPLTTVCTFCKGEMENKNVSVRTAAVEVIGALYHQIGPRLQAIAITDDMKPATKQLLTVEFERVGFDPSAQKTSKAADGGSGGGGGIPRQDISSMVDKNILSELNLIEGKTSWQNRKSAMEAIIAACDRSGHFIEYTKGLVEVVKALKLRVNDTQANLKPIAANAIGHIIASLDPEAGSKLMKLVASCLLGGLADSKKGVRDATIASLDVAVTQNKVGKDNADASLLSSLIGPVGEALVATPNGRQELLAWMLEHVEVLKVDASDLAVPLVIAMQDKTANVRLSAEQLLTILMSKSLVSRAVLDKATRDLPTATKRTLQPAIDRMMAAFGVRKAATTTSKESDGVQTEAVVDKGIESHAAPAPAPVPPATSIAKEAVVAVRSSISTLPPNPPPKSLAAKIDEVKQVIASVDVTSSPATATVDKWHLKKCNKTRRLEDFVKLNWPQPPEEPGDTEALALKATWEQIISPELALALFPQQKFGAPNQEAIQGGLVELSSQLECPHLVLHADLLLRWCAHALCLRESVTGLLRILQFVNDLFGVMSREGAQLHDAEASVILPYLIDKSGHKSERHKNAFKQAITAAGELLSPTKLVQFLLQGLTSKNKKSRVVCLEEALRVVEGAGISALGRSGSKEVGLCLDSKENDVSCRNACLELTYAMFLALGSDMTKLLKALGDLSERSKSMIEDRIKQKNRASAKPSAAPTTGVSPVKGGVFSPPPSAVTTRTPRTERKPSDADEGSPFRLNMTPPGEDGGVSKANKSSGKKKVEASSSWEGHGSPSSPTLPVLAMPTPGPSGKRDQRDQRDQCPSTPIWQGVPESPSSVVSPQSQSLDRTFAIITQKMDALLDLEAVVEESDLVHQEAVEGLKLLHSILMNEEAKSESSHDTELKVLHQYAHTFTSRLIRLIKRSFDYPCSSSSNGSTDSADSVSIDVSLVAVSLATLFAIVKAASVSKNLPQQTLYDIFGVCLAKLVDEKLISRKDSKDSKDSSEVTQSISCALNMVVLKLGAEAVCCDVVIVLLKLMFNTIPATDFNDSSYESSSSSNSSSSGSRAVMAMPIASAKPTSRLLLKVLDEEIKRPVPFDPTAFDQKAVLIAIHTFFKDHPVQTKHEIPFCTAKTVLAELIKKLGGASVLGLLEALKIPSDAFIMKLSLRLCEATQSTLGGTQGTVSAVPSAPIDSKLHAQITEVINDIVAARDKMLPIRQLHSLKRLHPFIDVASYLQGMSSAFRKFVVENLERLDNTEVVDENQQPPNDDSSNGSKAGVVVSPAPPLKTVTVTAASATDTSVAPTSSPRSQIIRGSFAKLTADLSNLDLPVVQGGNGGSDNDLAARLQRLKSNMEA